MSSFEYLKVAIRQQGCTLQQVWMRVVTGISFGFLFYVLDQIFGPLSLVYNIPPVLGALLPSAAFFAISVFMLLKRR